MSKASFVVAFEGPAVQDGTIDVRDLAPALLSLGQLVDAANRTLNGDKVPARVQAKAVSAGCFEVSLDVVLTNWEALKGFLISPDVEGAKALIEWVGLVGGVGGGLIALYRWLHGREVDKVERLDGGFVRITIGDSSIVTPMEVLRLYQEMAVNQAMNRLISSIEAGKIDRIEFRESPGAQASQTLTVEDKSTFQLPMPADETVVDEIRRMALSIRSLAFQEANKWRLYDGQNIITATIEDKNFLSRVDRNEIRFAKSDVLICEVQTIQRQGAEGLKTEHIIKRVLEHRPAPTQIALEMTGQF